MPSITPTKPYLVRAIYDWCVDNGFTPYIAVSVDANTRVPLQYVRDKQIVLNVAPYATQQLEISNEALTCQARFGGVAQLLYVPLQNIMAIYARENGRGMAFEPGTNWGTAMELGGLMDAEAAAKMETETAPAAKPTASPATPTPPSQPDSPPPTGGSRLRVVK
ncbi:ClpXP protease specificity-enhancing factor [Uliginosibacterium gangwonense]|uniref:ClpXP protease specificity-enhancing factor n=1 Tax=Uliginosibacterium gangwonense TaxID=392736 RepID=UPI00036C78A1|nr:ClpXP protease specificity-enhancing factor [Uliginosibacterium gangwonense]